MARPRRYTKKALRGAVERYFDSISREIEITEKVDSGKKDSYGHVIWDTVPVKNKLGEVATAMEYLIPPTIGSLCIHLGINSSTWSRWSDPEKYPEYVEIVEDVRQRMIVWRQEQVLTRKHIAGLIWDLETNYNAGKKEDKRDSKPDMVVTGLPEEFRV